MDAEQQIQKIKRELCCVDPGDMTPMELSIRDIVEEKRATYEEEERSRGNTARLMS